MIVSNNPSINLKYFADLCEMSKLGMSVRRYTRDTYFSAPKSQYLLSMQYPHKIKGYEEFLAAAALEELKATKTTFFERSHLPKAARQVLKYLELWPELKDVMLDSTLADSSGFLEFLQFWADKPANKSQLDLFTEELKKSVLPEVVEALERVIPGFKEKDHLKVICTMYSEGIHIELRVICPKKGDVFSISLRPILSMDIPSLAVKEVRYTGELLPTGKGFDSIEVINSICSLKAVRILPFNAS